MQGLLQGPIMFSSYMSYHKSATNLGHSFICPENVNKKTYFTGSNPFEVSELEVFGVNF